MSASVAPEVSTQTEILGVVRLLLAAAFVVTLPLLIVGTNLRFMVGDRDFLLAGFRDNGVGQVTGLDDRQLAHVADAFVAYFKARPGPMDVQVTIGGVQRALFNAREIQHMEDVQALVQVFLRLQVVAALVAAVRLAFALFVERTPRSLGFEMLLSAGLVVVAVALVGVLSVVDFTALWTVFHRVAFRNDLWQLDPSRDYLIMLFPEPFWYAATLRLALSTAAMTAAAAVAGFLAWRLAPPSR